MDTTTYNSTLNTMRRGMSTGEPVPDDVSALLRAWTDGDQRALAQLTPIVYDEFHRLAHRCLKGERAGHSLQTRRWSTKPVCAPSTTSA